MPAKPINNLAELLELIQALIDAGCAFDIALPGGSFTSRVVRYTSDRLELFNSKGVKTVVIL